MLRRRVSASPFGLATFNSQVRLGSGKDKVVSAEDAVHLVESGSTITVGGFVAQGAPEEVLASLGERYKQTGTPNNLTLLFGGGPGDWATKGLNHLAVPGMLRRTIGSHYGQTPMIAKLAQENQIEAYNLPLGSISRMIRCAGSGQPGHLTSVGFGTMADPAHGGGKINDVTKEDLVVPVEVLGKDYLLYKAQKVDVAIVRGTTADADGNVTMEKESLYCDHMIQALSARATRGLVIVQVERLAAKGSLAPRQVKIPGTLVDAVVVASKPEYHHMSYITPYNPGATSEVRTPPRFTKGGVDVRKVIARRAAMELSPGDIINLGIGMPEGIAEVCSEERVLDKIELTTEPGVHGGVGLSGHDFGPAVNYDAMLAMNQQFDFYNGGGLDACFLGNAETDPHGNVNVTRVGPKLTGPGGFVDISQSTMRVTLLGTFTAGGLKVEVTTDNKLRILQEGKVKKFVKSVKETTFSGATAVKRKQVVHYVTERCVFSLTSEGLELIEIAPGIDLQKDILDQMEFTPKISKNLRTMDSAIFTPRGLMGLKAINFSTKHADRLSYDKESNTLFVNYENATFHSITDVDAFFEAFEQFVSERVPTKGKFNVTANYDGYDCSDACADYWASRIKEVETKYEFLNVRRYTTRAFNRHRLSSAISIEDGRRYTLPAVKSFLKEHGMSAVPSNTVENLFNRALQEESTASLSEAQNSIGKEDFEKLIERVCRTIKPQYDPPMTK